MTVTSVPAPGLDSPRNWLALYALIPATLAVGLDATVANIALPTLATKFGASIAELQWFVIAYALAFAAALIPAGLLGDRWGRKRTLLLALVVFGAASAACAYAPSSVWFIAARVLLGFGGAAILPMALAALPTLFSRAVRPRALTTLMTVSMIGFPIGPLLGGWILVHAWWGWAFLMNVPVVILAFIAIAALMPESRGEQTPSTDVPGIVLVSTALVGLTYGVTRAGQDGWGSITAWACIAAGIGFGVAFVGRERRTPHPLVDLALFKDRAFGAGTLLASAVSFVMFGLLFAIPQFAQGVMGVDPQGAGLRLVPFVVGMIASGVLGERVARRVGARPIILAGMGVIAVAMAVGARTTVSSGDALMAGWATLAGLGLGLALPTAMDVAMGALRTAVAGTGSAVLQASRMVAGSFGAAILGSVVSIRYRDALDASGGLVALSPDAAIAARSGLQGALRVASGLDSSAIAEVARRAFTSGIDLMLVVAAAVTALAAVAAMLVPARREMSSSTAESEA